MAISNLTVILYVVERIVGGARDPYERQPSDQLRDSAVQLHRQDGGLLEGGEPATDDRGGAQDVQEDQNVFENVHGSSLATICR